ERAAVDSLKGTWIQTDTGYKVTGLTKRSWSNDKDLEFVYTGIYPWSEARIGVASVETAESETMFTMTQPAYDNAVKLYHSTMPEASTDYDNYNEYEMYGLSRPTQI